jgi:protein ImuB
MVLDLIHRYSSFHVQDFPVQALLRGQSAISYEKDCVAVVDSLRNRRTILSCNALARRAGIIAGMTKAQAEAVPNVKFGTRDKDKEESAHEALMDCGFSMSPYVEAAFPETMVMDLTGTGRLLGSPRDIGELLVERAARCGLKVDVALAANPDTALCVARGFPGVTVIAPGTEARRLAALPLNILPLEPEIADALQNWGIRDFGSLAELPTLSLIQRLGQAGVYLQRLARGEIQRSLVPCEPIAQFQESVDFEEPLELLERLIYGLDPPLQQLVQRLKMRALATDCLHIDFELEINRDRQLKSGRATGAGPSSYHRTLKLPVPTQDINALRKLLELELTGHPPQSAVKKVTINAIPARMRSAQSGFFERSGSEPVDLEVSFAKLRAAIGERDKAGCHKVGFPVAENSHQPDSFSVLPSPWKISIPHKECKYRTDSGLADRLFRPPIKAKVELKGDVPVAVIFEGTRKTVMNASGPWRKIGRWWSSIEKWNRDEWDVELSIGEGLYRIYRDCVSGDWFVYSIYT